MSFLAVVIVAISGGFISNTPNHYSRWGKMRASGRGPDKSNIHENQTKTLNLIVWKKISAGMWDIKSISELSLKITAKSLHKCSFSKAARCWPMVVCFSSLFVSTMQLYLLVRCKSTRGHKQRDQFTDVFQNMDS